MKEQINNEQELELLKLHHALKESKAETNLSFYSGSNGFTLTVFKPVSGKAMNTAMFVNEYPESKRVLTKMVEQYKDTNHD